MSCRGSTDTIRRNANWFFTNLKEQVACAEPDSVAKTDHFHQLRKLITEKLKQNLIRQVKIY